jgi:lipopolysaccharide cholinephosphotransferase
MRLKVKIKRVIEKHFKGLLKYKSLPEEVKTLQYFLNELHSPLEIAIPQDKDLLLLQKCDTELLCILDKFFHKHAVKYWLTAGTLLGAVRHGRSIPWDDDSDIQLPREDYNRVLNELNQEIKSLGLEILETDEWVGIGYRHQETGIWVDLFPTDEVCYTGNYRKCKARYIYDKEILLDCFNASNATIEKRTKMIKKYILDKCDSEGQKWITNMSESENIPYFMKKEDVYPLGTIDYDGYSLSIPNNPHKYLVEYVGKSYMQFPRNGVLHHGETTGRPPLSQWARLHGVNMQEILLELKEISKKI